MTFLLGVRPKILANRVVIRNSVMRAPPGAEASGYKTTPGEPGFGRGLALKAPLRGRRF